MTCTCHVHVHECEFIGIRISTKIHNNGKLWDNTKIIRLGSEEGKGYGGV